MYVDVPPDVLEDELLLLEDFSAAFFAASSAACFLPPLPAHFQNSFTTNHMLHKVPITIPITPNMYRTFCSVCFENVIRVMTVAPATIPRAKPILTAIPLTIIVNIILIKSILF